MNLERRQRRRTTGAGAVTTILEMLDIMIGAIAGNIIGSVHEHAGIQLETKCAGPMEGPAVSSLQREQPIQPDYSSQNGGLTDISSVDPLSA